MSSYDVGCLHVSLAEEQRHPELLRVLLTQAFDLLSSLVVARIAQPALPKIRSTLVLSVLQLQLKDGSSERAIPSAISDVLGRRSSLVSCKHSFVLGLMGIRELHKPIQDHPFSGGECERLDSTHLRENNGIRKVVGGAMV